MIKNLDVIRAAGKPTNYEELVSFLTREPWVRKYDEVFSRRFTGADDSKHLRFTGTQDGADGEGYHTPCGGPCGPGGFLPVLTFELDFFQIEMFGHKTMYYYHRGPK